MDEVLEFALGLERPKSSENGLLKKTSKKKKV